MTIKSLQDRLQTIDRRIQQQEARRQTRQERLTRLEKELAELADLTDLLSKTEATLLHISTRVLGQSTKNIDKLVTVGLRLAFDDQSLEFRTHTDKARGKTAIKFELLEDGRATPLLTSYGGGVLVVIGVLLRAFTIVSLGMRRVLYLDESLAFVGDQYVGNTSRLLRKLADELNFKILMVTHNAEFAANATSHYKAIRKGGGTTFEKTNP